jgi:NADH:ubiquinone oxidoreductase subunit C
MEGHKLKIVKNNARNFNLTTLMLAHTSLFYLFAHIKLTSWFYSAQLLELFSYEIQPLRSGNTTNLSLLSTFVYNFNVISSQHRLMIFAKSRQSFNVIKGKDKSTLVSIADLFLNAWWLERELGEMVGQRFTSQRDSRNLLLMYGDATMPLLKSFPSIGIREIFFDSTSDTLVQSPVSIQF